MDTIRINVTGDNRVGLRFDEFPDELYQGLRAEIEALSSELFARVQAATPDLTGALRSQERLRLFTDQNSIKGYVDIDGGSGSYAYAKAGGLEYGAHKPAHVSAYSRPLDVMVSAYDRTPNIEEHAFERGPLEAMQPEIISRLNAVVEQAVAMVNE